MKTEFILVLTLAILAYPVIAIEYHTYENEIFKVEYPTNWIVSEPQRDDSQPSAFESRLKPYQEPQELDYSFYNAQAQKAPGNVETKLTQMVSVQVTLPDGGINIDLPDYHKSFRVFNATGYIDDPLLKGLNETEYMNDLLLHFLSTFQVKPNPNLKKISVRQLPPFDEQIKKISEKRVLDEAASVALSRFQNLSRL